MLRKHDYRLYITEYSPWNQAFTITLFIWSMLLVGPIFLDGQSARVFGRVFAEDRSQVLPGANIQMDSLGTFSDENGAYRLTLPPGNHVLRFTFIGFQAVTRQVRLAPGDKLRLDVIMTAQSALLETATVSSGRYEKPLSEVVVSLEAIKPALLENANQIQLDQALEKVPGVTVIDGQANIRGGSGFSYGAGSRVLLLINDLPILTADAGFPNWNDIPLENMSQIEVIKGASSALYGSAALNGVVNFRTAYATSEPVTHVSVFSNTFLQPPAGVRAWWSEPPLGFGATLLHKQKIGRFDLVANAAYINEQEHNKDTYARYGRLGLQTRYRITDSLHFGVNFNYRDGENQDFFFWAQDRLLEGSEGTFAYATSQRYNIDPFISYRDRKGFQHKLLSRIYVVDNQADQGRANRTFQYYGEYQVQKRIKELDLMANFGLVARGARVSAELYGDTTFTMQNYALYGQLEKKLWKKLNITAGFRWEENYLDNPGFTYQTGRVAPSEERESRPVFRFGMNYQLGAATFLRGSWGEGYRFPTIAEKYIFTTFAGLFISPNPALQSETGWNLEVGIKQGYKFGGFQGFMDLAAFHSRYDNMMEFRFQQNLATGFQSQNIGGANISGFEFSLTGQAQLGNVQLSYLGGYLFIDPRYREFDLRPIEPGVSPSLGQLNASNSSSEEDILKYRSPHSWKIDLQADWPRLGLGGSFRYAGHQEAVDPLLLFAIPDLVDFREKYDRGYRVLDIRVSYRLLPELKIAILANNVLNEVYSLRPGLLEAPRNLAFRLDWDL